jgi:hypothetical protein
MPQKLTTTINKISMTPNSNKPTMHDQRYGTSLSQGAIQRIQELKGRHQILLHLHILRAVQS